MGAFPTLDTYRRLKPLIGYYHLKGGRTESGGTSLKWKSALEVASWPVEAITRQVITDGVSPVICLNGSHGESPESYRPREVLERDLAFVRKQFPEVR